MSLMLTIVIAKLGLHTRTPTKSSYINNKEKCVEPPINFGVLANKLSISAINSASKSTSILLSIQFLLASLFRFHLPKSQNSKGFLCMFFLNNSGNRMILVTNLINFHQHQRGVTQIYPFLR